MFAAAVLMVGAFSTHAMASARWLQKCDRCGNENAGWWTKNYVRGVRVDTCPYKKTVHEHQAITPYSLVECGVCGNHTIEYNTYTECPYKN